jgi:predicted MPP superfamily phosphohydrolase
LPTLQTERIHQIWHRVHILELSNLYVLLVKAILGQKPNLPTGKTGYYFAENGYQSWKIIAERIGGVGKKIGAFETSGVEEITLEEAAEEFYHGDLRDAEAVLASKYVFHSPKLTSKQEGSFRLTQPARERKQTGHVRF